MQHTSTLIYRQTKSQPLHAMSHPARVESPDGNVQQEFRCPSTASQEGPLLHLLPVVCHCLHHTHAEWGPNSTYQSNHLLSVTHQQVMQGLTDRKVSVCS